MVEVEPLKKVEQMRWWHGLGVVAALVGPGMTLWFTASRNPDFFGGAAKYVTSLGGALVILGGLFGLGFVSLRAFRYVRSRLPEPASLKARLDLLEQQLSWRDLDRASLFVARAKFLWGGTNPLRPPALSYEDDPVFLQISLDAGLRKILSQPIVQRLNHIRQLSFAYLVFGSATHARLAHCLGACRNAELVMTKVFQEGRLYTRDGVENISLSEDETGELLRLAKVAALLHDLGHGPLSHALDTHIGLAMPEKTTKPDKRLSIISINEFLRPAISDAGVDPDKVTALMQKDRLGFSPWMHFIADLIDSPLDVDRMDYLVRDAHMTGLSVGGLNIQALIERAMPFKEVEPDGTTKIELAFDHSPDQSALPYIEQFLYARDVMYLNCYEHQKKVCAEGMLGRAFEDFRQTTLRPDLGLGGLALLTDQELMQMVLDCSGPSTISFRLVEMLMKGIVFELIREVPVEIELKDPNRPDSSSYKNLPLRVHVWANEVMDEDYESAYLVTPEDWARDLVRKCGSVSKSQILVTVPSLSIIEKWAKEGEIRLLKKDAGEGYSVPYVRDLPNTIWKDFVVALARARLKIRVFVDPELTADQKAVVLEESGTFFS